ncbi:uncharacterized protein LOC131895456 [Peromyscus eremicus]|uniref:uncharacterized protein LOC131895456 n=1 Tax=Peromyscus eremicus TaxID=42410 RepID=UPI0027DD59E4|nr:uncharacterized protein LOC131895456 [Peromyscus eremicus]
MNRLIKKFKKTNISPVTGREYQDEVEEQWGKVASKVKNKAGMKSVNVTNTLTNPDVVEQELEGCSKAQTTALLMKTVQDIDKDRLMGKRLALNIVRKEQERSATPGWNGRNTVPSFPVSTQSKRTPIRSTISALNPFSTGGGSNHPKFEMGTKFEEIRPYTPQEISELRKDYAQNGQKDAEYMCRLWEKGADTVMLTDLEMRKIRNIVENPSVSEALEHVIETSKGDTHPLLDWITAAWRFAFPTLDLTQFESAAQWTTYAQAIKQCRKLGILYFIYNQVPTPQAAPFTPQFKKIIIKGAPAHLKMSLAGPLQACQTISDAMEFFKSYREMDIDKVVSFNVNKKQDKKKVTPRFSNIRPFGKPNQMPIRQNANKPWNPIRRLTGRKNIPWRETQSNPWRQTYQPKLFLGNRNFKPNFRPKFFNQNNHRPPRTGPPRRYIPRRT